MSSSLIGTQGVYTISKKPIVDIKIVMFPKMMVHPETKQMMMVPMQDFMYKREGSDEWFSMPIEESEKHEFNPEVKQSKIITE